MVNSVTSEGEMGREGEGEGGRMGRERGREGEGEGGRMGRERGREGGWGGRGGGREDREGDGKYFLNFIKFCFPHVVINGI